jgi:hypothetical protein
MNNNTNPNFYRGMPNNGGADATMNTNCLTSSGGSAMSTAARSGRSRTSNGSTRGNPYNSLEGGGIIRSSILTGSYASSTTSRPGIAGIDFPVDQSMFDSSFTGGDVVGGVGVGFHDDDEYGAILPDDIQSQQLLRQQEVLQQQLDEQELRLYEHRLLQRQLEQQKLQKKLEQQQQHLEQQQLMLRQRQQQIQMQQQQRRQIQGQNPMQGMMQQQAHQNIAGGRFNNNNMVLPDIQQSLFDQQQQQLNQQEQRMLKEQMKLKQMQQKHQMLLNQQMYQNGGQQLQQPMQQHNSTIAPGIAQASNFGSGGVGRVPPLAFSTIQHQQHQQYIEQTTDIMLPADYEPTNTDICSGRGKAFWNHAGNVTFRQLIQSQVDSYIRAPSKAEKSAIVNAIVEDLRRNGCKFLKQEKNPQDGGMTMIWYDMGDAQARDKVGHSLRDQVTAINRLNRDTGGTATTTATAGAVTTTGSGNRSTDPKVIDATTNKDIGNSTSPNITKNPNPLMSVAPASAPLPGAIVGKVPGPLKVQQQRVECVDDDDDDDDDYVRQRMPSISISDSGNESEARRTTLDTSALLVEFGRRPSFVLDSITSDVTTETAPDTSSNVPKQVSEYSPNESKSSLQRESKSQLRSAMLLEDDQFPMGRVFPKNAPVRKQQNSNNKRDRNISGDLITNSIQTLDTNYADESMQNMPMDRNYSGIGLGGGTNMQRNQSVTMSGGSTLRLNSSMARNSTMRMSELSLLSGNFDNMSMSIAPQNSDSSINNFDQSTRFEL